jgi:hypothetical protein
MTGLKIWNRSAGARNDLHRFFHGQKIAPVVSRLIDAETNNAASVGVVMEKLGFGIKCCEVALSAGSARIWEDNIRNARKAHHIAERFVHRFKLSEPDSGRISQRMTHLKTLLDELR